jgi:hypothetical protein
MKKSINFELAESSARLGCSQKTIAAALGFSESGFGNCKAHNEKLRSCLERGWANSEVDLMVGMHNKGLGKHYHDPAGPERDKKIGFDGDARLMIHLDERLTGGTVKKVQISGDNVLHYWLKA